MAYSDTTTYYNLPQWVEDDHPTFMGDMNTALSEMDSAMHEVAEDSATAVSDAESAVTTATTANTTAASALTTAETASATATAAQETADSIADTAESALTTAESAATAAATAQSTAESAATAAATAQSTAESAATAAATAQSAADAAQSDIDSIASASGYGTNAGVSTYVSSQVWYYSHYGNLVHVDGFLTTSSNAITSLLKVASLPSGVAPLHNTFFTMFLSASDNTDDKEAYGYVNTDGEIYVLADWESTTFRFNFGFYVA